MKTAHLKSAVLSGLVLLSAGLSYVLWHGDWQNATEVAYSDGQSLPTAQSPGNGDVSIPYEVLFTSGHPAHYALGTKDSPLYTDWTNRLANIHIYALHTVQAIPDAKATTSVRFRFGTQIAYHDLSRWVPGLPPSALVKSADAITLFQGADKHTVQFALESEEGDYVADTDLTASEFTKRVADVTETHRWVAWNLAADSLVPRDGLTMFKIRYKRNDTPLLPTVHSFFVNPQALSRVQETPKTILWTDGSRVVWLDQTANILTFANPNTSATETGTGEDLTSAMQFVRNHGGAPEDVLAFQDGGNRTATVTFRRYVDGFPVLGPLGEYAVELENGLPIQYRRPMTEWGAKLDETVVHTLGADQLAQILQGLMPNTPLGNVVVQLGYLEQNPDQGTVELVPAYYISQSGTPLWVIDASTGKVIRGMKSQ